MILATSPGAKERITKSTKVTAMMTGISISSLFNAYFNQFIYYSYLKNCKKWAINWLN